jgi:hypothetical protein
LFIHRFIYAQEAFFDDKKTEEDVKDVTGVTSEEDVNKDDVNIQLSCTEYITITRNACATERCEKWNKISRDRDESQLYDTLYNPRESLARNYAITFDRRVRYIRVCDNGACEPTQSYIVNLNNINQTLQNGAFQDEKVYRLEGSSSLNDKNVGHSEIKTNEQFAAFADASPDDILITYNIQMTTVLYTTVPINAKLTVHDISTLIYNGPIKVYIKTPEKVRDEFTLHKCIPVNGNSNETTCDLIAWSESAHLPIIESTESKISVVIRYLGTKEVLDKTEYNTAKLKYQVEEEEKVHANAKIQAMDDKIQRDIHYPM